MNVAYWVIAGLLALFYVYSGGKKVLQSQVALMPMMGWVDTVPMPLVRMIGALELLGAVGLVAPPLTDIAPALAVGAAVSFAILQIAAATLHLSRGEAKQTGLNVGLFVLALVAAILAPSTF